MTRTLVSDANRDDLSFVQARLRRSWGILVRRPTRFRLPPIIKACR